MATLITMVLDMDEDQQEEVFGVSGDVDLLINPEYYTEIYYLRVEED